MNITFFIGGLSGGGAERVVCNLANYTSSKKNDVTILTMTDAPATYELNNKIRRVSLILQDERKNAVVDFIRRYYRLCKFLKTNKSDVYIVMLPITIILLLHLNWLTKAKIIVSERSNPKFNKPIEKFFIKHLASRADGWVFQTEENFGWYKRYINKSKIAIIPNAVGENFVSNVGGVVKRDKNIVTAGRLADPKNHQLLIRAFARIQSKFPDYKVMLYGDGPDKENLQFLAKGLGISESVLFPGYCKNIAEKIENASLFVFTSDWEGMPNALIEAMGLGVPCISTDFDGGGAKFLINPGNNGLLVPVGDADALAKAMERMLSDRDFAEKCGQEARKICERLSPSKIYGEWESFIKTVVVCA